MDTEQTNILSNRVFQHTNFMGSITTWIFYNLGDKVNIKAGWLGINTVNSTVGIESLGGGKYISKNFKKQKFTPDKTKLHTSTPNFISPTLNNNISSSLLWW